MLQRWAHELLVHRSPRWFGGLRWRRMRADLLVVDWLIRRLAYWLHVVLDFWVEWFLLFLAYSVDLPIHLASLSYQSVVLAFDILLLDQLLLLFEELLLKCLALLLLRVLDLHARQSIEMIILIWIPLIELFIAHRQRIIVLILYTDILDVL